MRTSEAAASRNRVAIRATFSLRERVEATASEQATKSASCTCLVSDFSRLQSYSRHSTQGLRSNSTPKARLRMLLGEGDHLAGKSDVTVVTLLPGDVAAARSGTDARVVASRIDCDQLKG